MAPAPFPTVKPDRVASVVEVIAPVTASAPEFTAASVEVPDADSVVNAPVLAVEAPTVPLMLIDAVPVKLVTTPADGVPIFGVTNVGDVANTKKPVPVSSLMTPANSAEVVEDRTLILSAVFTNVDDAGIVVPFKIVVDELFSVVNAPVDATLAPTVVPFIDPPVIVTFDRASISIALLSSSRVIFFISSAEESYIKKKSSVAVLEPPIAVRALTFVFAKSSRASG
jgi:hypothetical protein